MKRWQGSQGRIKGYERERLREEKVQSIIRKLIEFCDDWDFFTMTAQIYRICVYEIRKYCLPLLQFIEYISIDTDWI